MGFLEAFLPDRRVSPASVTHYFSLLFFLFNQRQYVPLITKRKCPLGFMVSEDLYIGVPSCFFLTSEFLFRIVTSVCADSFRGILGPKVQTRCERLLVMLQ